MKGTWKPFSSSSRSTEPVTGAECSGGACGGEVGEGFHDEGEAVRSESVQCTLAAPAGGGEGKG